MEIDERNAFLRAVEKLLGAPASFQSEGAARIMTTSLRGRQMDIGTNGAMLWINCDFVWPNLREDALFMCAPHGSYLRAKMIEDGDIPATTGDLRFDNAYLLLGPGGAGLAGELNKELRSVLLDFADLWPAFRLYEVVFGEPPRHRPHIHVTPVLRDEPDFVGAVPMGTQRFTPEYCAIAADRTAALANALDAHLADD